MEEKTKFTCGQKITIVIMLSLLICTIIYVSIEIIQDKHQVEKLCENWNYNGAYKVNIHEYRCYITNNNQISISKDKLQEYKGTWYIH